MKGSMEGVLPMLGLVILSMAMATQSLPLADALAEIVGDSTESIERIVDTRAYSDYYFFNNVGLVAEYSSNEASYSLGLEEGGHDSWNNNWLDSSSEEQIHSIWKKHSTEILNSEVTGSEGSDCELPDLKYNIISNAEADGNDHDIEINVSEDESDSLQTTCLSGSGPTKYVQDDDIINYETVRNNRYMHLVEDTLDFLRVAESELGDLSGEEYEGDSTVCSLDVEGDTADEAEERAESEARDNLDEAVEAQLSEAMSRFEEKPFVELLEDPVDNFHAPGNWEHVSGNVTRDGETDSERIGDCGCCCSGEDCDCDGPCGNRYEGEASGEPERVHFDWKIEDKDQEVLVDESNENLVFKIEPFTYYW